MIELLLTIILLLGFFMIRTMIDLAQTKRLLKQNNDVLKSIYKELASIKTMQQKSEDSKGKGIVIDETR